MRRTFAQYMKSYYKVPDEKDTSVKVPYGVISLIFILALFSIPAFMYWNKAQTRKDCAKAIYDYSEYNIQPEKLLVEACSKLGIEMKP